MNENTKKRERDMLHLSEDDKKALYDFMGNYKANVKIKILQDNKYLISELVFENIQIAVRKLLEKNINFQGFGSKEFYISTGSEEYTIQVSSFEFDAEFENL